MAASMSDDEMLVACLNAGESPNDVFVWGSLEMLVGGCLGVGFMIVMMVLFLFVHIRLR